MVYKSWTKKLSNFFTKKWVNRRTLFNGRQPTSQSATVHNFVSTWTKYFGVRNAVFITKMSSCSSNTCASSEDNTVRGGTSILKIPSLDNWSVQMIGLNVNFATSKRRLRSPSRTTAGSITTARVSNVQSAQLHSGPGRAGATTSGTFTWTR